MHPVKWKAATHRGSTVTLVQTENVSNRESAADFPGRENFTTFTYDEVRLARGPQQRRFRTACCIVRIVVEEVVRVA